MPFRYLQRPAYPAALFLALPILLFGCGGGGGGPTTTPVHVDIQWPARSRQVNAVSSALSATVTLKGANPDGSDFAFIVNRDTTPAAYTRTEVSPGPARTGTWELQARFYTQPGSSGSVVGTADAQVLLRPDGTLAKPDGSALGSIDTVGTAATVFIAPFQRIVTGQTADLDVTATDTSNNVLAITPGSIFYQVTAGTDNLQVVNGQLKGLASGQAMVTATVDGKASPPQTVFVSADIHIQTLQLSANDIIYDAARQKIYASVPSNMGGSLGNTITVIDPANGTVGPSIPIGSEPAKLAISDDDQFLYVGLNGAAAIRRVNLATMSPDIQFSLGSDQFLGPYYPGDIAVMPGSPHTVAVSLRRLGVSPAFGGVAIYDDGVRRPTVVGSYPTEIDSIAFGATASRLYGYNNETTGYEFTRMNVDANGVTAQDSTGNLLQGFNVQILFAGGSVYSSNGRVIDPEARTVVGTYELGSAGFSGVSFFPDPALNLVYFVTSEFQSSIATLEVFNAKSFVQVSRADIPITAGSPEPNHMPGLVKWGQNGLAFNTNRGEVVLLSPIPTQ